VSVARTRVLAAAGVAFGAMWLFAAGAKIASPLASYELVARAVPPGLAPKPLLAAAIAVEACLGAAMVLRAVRGLAWSLAGLAAASATAAVVWADAGNQVQCGCFGAFFGATLDAALARNAVLAAVHVALMLWCRAGRSPVPGR
jgi:hypothetical protein